MKRILLAEDEVQVRRLLERFLAARGYEIVSARNGEEALVKARALTGTIDLLLSDVDMPGINGPMLAETLQAQRSGLKVILMSGTHVVVPSDRPGWEFVRKPFDLRFLVDKIGAFLD